jgi:hypothetical protein
MRCALLILGGVLLAACSPRGARDFVPPAGESTAADTATVYLYRRPGMLGGARCNTDLGDELLGALGPGRYTRRFVAPGTTRIVTRGGSVALLTVHLDAGEEVFVRQRWVLGPSGFEARLDHMPRIKALPEIARCSFVEHPPLIEEDAAETEEQGAERPQ